MSNILSEDFKSNLKEFLDIDNQIKEATKSISIIKKRKNELADMINIHMKKHEIDELNIGDGKIKTYKTVKTESLNKKIILDRCVLLCNNDYEKGKKMCEFICDPEARTKTESTGIKRTTNKKKK